MRTFEQALATLDARGFKFHVFQSYGNGADETRGHSQSFTEYAAARSHARKVPAGIVYDSKGNDVSFCP